jgi:hypothetical protein
MDIYTTVKDWFMGKGHRHSSAPPSAPRIRRVDLHIYYERNRTVSTATITIVDPTTRTDGAVLSPADIASIDIFDDASPTPTVPIGVVQGAGTSFTTGVLSVGVHNFTAIVNDTTGHSSASSVAASVTVVATLAPPSVAVITATLNP